MPKYQSAFSPRRFSSTTTPTSEDDADETIEIQDEGDYQIIIPPQGSQAGRVQKGRKNVYRLLPNREPELPPYATQEAIRRFEQTGEHDEGIEGDGLIRLGTEEESHLRSAGALAARVLRRVGARIMATPGLTTDAVDDLVISLLAKPRAYPSPLNYMGFPRACCTSVNNIVAHGIPDGRILCEGDIVNLDITVYYHGYHGDTSRTFSVGRVDAIGRDLLSVTEEALEAGIAVCGPGRPFRDIAKAIHGVIEGKDYVVCPAFTGHGIGRAFHQPPWILHDLNEEPEIMKPGHCFTIEPCIIKGSDSDIAIWPDGWTATTASGARSAQAEHMVLITETGAEVLTRDDSWLKLPNEQKMRRLSTSS